MTYLHCPSKKHEAIGKRGLKIRYASFSAETSTAISVGRTAACKAASLSFASPVS